jgi:serine/threonine protein phosphatase PrpC
MGMKYQLAQHSLRGARKTNEDRVAVVERENSVLMMLADGLGGHQGGALAAEVLIKVATYAFQAIKQPVILKPSALLALTMMQAHKMMRARGETHNPPISPRTTCVLCLVQNGYAYWAHVGDSRLYHFRDNQVIKRTLDHTNIEQLHVDGLLSEEEMLTHPDKSRLLKCLGGTHTPSISLGAETRLQPGDTLLLCTDGLWEAFNPEELVPYLQYKSLEEGVEEMLHDGEEKMQKTCDNLSAICLRWEQGVTDTPPLQVHSLTQIDQQMLWDEANRKIMQRKIKGTVKETEDKSIKTAIKEIESIIKQLDSKS